MLSFCEEFATLLENDITDTRNPIIVGDLNIHMEDTTSADTRLFLDVLESLNLQNRVGFPTHISKHTIDLIIHDKLLGGVANVQPGHFLSDHCLIHCTLDAEKPKQPSQVISYRKLKAINIKEFAMNISENMSNIANSTTVHEAVDIYNTILRQALDQHAPVKQKEIKVCHDLPWFNENIKEEIRLQCYKERLWRCNPNEYTQQAFYNQRRYVANLIYSTKRNFLRQKIQECSKDSKAIFKLTNKMLFCKEDLPLPATDNIKELAQEFGNFFDAKITKIMNALAPTAPDQISSDYIECDFQTKYRLSSFRVPSLDELTTIIKKTATKSCELDPIPTQLLKEALPAVTPIIGEVVKLSLTYADVSSNLKEALLQLLLKKAGLDTTPQNYRPVSNLSYLSKVIEKVACNQLVDYTEQTGMTEKYQSAYKHNHSTESALLHVRTDILQAMDNQEVTCLILLDLSAAFDTVSHSLLLNRLRYRFGVTDMALNWIESYLKDHTQSMVLGDMDTTGAKSEAKHLKQGVPQGSILGPTLFTLYISPLGDICRSHEVLFQSYADDQQIYLSFKPKVHKSRDICLDKLENCVSDL